MAMTTIGERADRGNAAEAAPPEAPCVSGLELIRDSPAMGTANRSPRPASERPFRPCSRSLRQLLYLVTILSEHPVATHGNWT